MNEMKRKFIETYILNRALGHQGGIGVEDVFKDACWLWDRLDNQIPVYGKPDDTMPDAEASNDPPTGTYKDHCPRCIKKLAWFSSDLHDTKMGICNACGYMYRSAGECPVEDTKYYTMTAEIAEDEFGRVVGVCDESGLDNLKQLFPDCTFTQVSKTVYERARENIARESIAMHKADAKE